MPILLKKNVHQQQALNRLHGCSIYVFRRETSGCLRLWSSWKGLLPVIKVDGMHRICHRDGSHLCFAGMHGWIYGRIYIHFVTN